jgi:hypothetical protein
MTPKMRCTLLGFLLARQKGDNFIPERMLGWQKSVKENLDTESSFYNKEKKPEIARVHRSLRL